MGSKGVKGFKKSHRGQGKARGKKRTIGFERVNGLKWGSNWV